jgi:hypothetical protein
MALVKCPECATEVSDTAMKCTKCGVQLRKPQRTFFGKLIKWFFIIFNGLMALWLIIGMNAASKIGAETAAEKAGAAIGTGIGVVFVLSIWGFGIIVLERVVNRFLPKSRYI